MNTIENPNAVTVEMVVVVVECYCFLIIIIVRTFGARRYVIYNTFVDGCLKSV